MTAPHQTGPRRRTDHYQPPHAPEYGVRMRRLLGAYHVTGVFWFRIHCFGVKRLPKWSIGPLIFLFTCFFFVVLTRVRRAVGSNLAAVLGPCGFWERQRRAFRNLHAFAWCMSERYERLSTDRRVTVTVEGDELWQRSQASGDGVILVTAHVGHWEVGSMLAPTKDQRHVHVVREEEMDPRSQEYIRELFARQDAQGFTMHFAHDDPLLGTKLLKALRSGDMVAVQGDRPRTGGRTCRAELFGRPVELPAGPAALARAAGVELQPVYVFRTGRQRARVVFRPPIRVGDGDDRRGDLNAAARRIAAEVEWAIRQDPYQWFCFRELWPASREERR